MKKYILFYTGLQAAAVTFFMMFCLTFVKNLSIHEVHTVQNLAGSTISAYPETESVFLQALGNPSTSLINTGEEMLSRYGYDETAFLSGNPLYRQSLSASLCIFTVLFLFSLLSGYHYFYSVKKQQNAQNALLSSLLERCLSDDYSFLEHPEEMTALHPDSVADTFLKLVQKLRLKSEALLEEKDHTKTLVTDISHQLKTPLSALKTCFSIYLEADTETEKEEFGARCRFQLDKLEHLTTSLINISRLENAMIHLQPVPASLTDILIEAVNAVYAKASARQITIIAEDSQDITLLLDKKWTTEALFNLLDNAVKYSPVGSLIQIRIQALYSFVRVEIEDHGIGIPKEEYNQIFKRFYRGRNELVQKSEGSGVGLYLSRKILEEQGGTLSVKAARDRGSIFVVQLPLSSFISPQK